MSNVSWHIIQYWNYWCTLHYEKNVFKKSATFEWSVWRAQINTRSSLLNLNREITISTIYNKSNSANHPYQILQYLQILIRDPGQCLHRWQFLCRTSGTTMEWLSPPTASKDLSISPLLSATCHWMLDIRGASCCYVLPDLQWSI